MIATTLIERKSISVSDFRCTAGPGDKPFAEQHSRHSISYVRKGSFGLHCRGKFSELVAGSVLIGHPGDEYTCTHDHVCGDECLSFFLAPELVEAIGEGSTKPLVKCDMQQPRAQLIRCLEPNRRVEIEVRALN